MSGAAVQGSIIAFLAFAVDSIQGERKIGIPFLDNVIGSNLATLVLMIAILFILLFFSTVAAYYAAIKSRYVASAYHKKCSLRSLKLFNRIRFFNPLAFNYTETGIKKVATRSSMLMGKSVENIVRAIQPLLYLIAAVAVISVLNIRLSLILAPFFVFLMPFIYNLSSDIQTNAKRFYGGSIRDNIGRIQKMLSLINKTNVNPECAEKYIEKEYRENEKIKTYYRDHNKLLLGRTKAVFITSIFKSFLLVFVLFVLGYSALNNSLSWGIITAFIVAFLHMSNNLQTLVGNLSILNRFYPMVSNYIDFYNIAGRFSKSGSKRPKSFPDEITLAGNSTVGGEKYQLVIRPGDRVICISNRGLNRLEFPSLVTPLIESSSLPKSHWYNSCFLSSLSGVFSGTILDSIGGDDTGGKNLEQVEQILKDSGLSNEIEALPEGLMTEINDEVWEGLSNEVRLTIKFLPLLFSDCKIIFVDLNLFKKVNYQACLRLFDFFSDRILFFTTEQIKVDRQYAETVIVTGDRGIVGTGDMEWLRSIEPELEQVGIKTRDEDTLVDALTEEETQEDEYF
jgi:ABC-type multidrug transport system fused ATPase/permease subunit